MRYWENWDKGSAAEDIDAYWLKSEGGWRQMIAGKIMEFVGGNVPILEVGCGSGLICEAMMSKGMNAKNYVGVDVSLKMLEIAKKRFPSVDLREMDAMNMTFSDAFFPAVISVHVLQHMPSFERALDEMVRVAGKKLYVVCWFADQEKIRFSEPSDKWSGQRFYNNRYTKDQFEERVRRCPRVTGVKWVSFGGENAAMEVSLG